MKTTRLENKHPVSDPDAHATPGDPSPQKKGLGFGLELEVRISTIHNKQRLLLVAEAGFPFSADKLTEDPDLVRLSIQDIAAAILFRALALIRLRNDPEIVTIKGKPAPGKVEQLIGLLQADKVNIGTTKVSVSSDGKQYIIQTTIDRN